MKLLIHIVLLLAHSLIKLLFPQIRIYHLILRTQAVRRLRRADYIQPVAEDGTVNKR